MYGEWRARVTTSRVQEVGKILINERDLIDLVCASMQTQECAWGDMVNIDK